MPSTARTAAVLTAIAAATTALAVAPAQAATPPPVVVYDQETYVCEQSPTRYVDFLVRKGDRVSLTAGGDIWSGVWLEGRTGPPGRTGEYADRYWPLPGARKYALLVHIDGGLRYAGPEYYRVADRDQTLRLRINDNVANGNGCFSVHVVVRR